jgi:hypothetical protein
LATILNEVSVDDNKTLQYLGLIILSSQQKLRIEVDQAGVEFNAGGIIVT